MEELYPVGALCKTPDEIDPRDYQAEYVFGAITDDMLNDLPRKVDLIKIIDETYNQGNVGACTAFALVHTMLSQNILDFGTNKIFIDPVYQRTVNQGKPRASNSGGDYLENAARTARNNGVKGRLADGTEHTFKIDGYVTENRETDFERFLKVITYRLKNNGPLYWSFRGNTNTRRECTAGEIVTVYKLSDGANMGHAVMLGGIDWDKREVYFGNSRRWNNTNNDGRLSLSKFKISFDVFEQLLNNHIFNFRYWILFDYKDIKMDRLFDDFVGVDENSEAYKAVKRAKDSGVIKGVPTINGFRLEPNRPITRLETLLVLYRLSQKE